MNSALVTTGPEIMTVGSTLLFQLKPYLNGLLWALSGATLLLTSPTGVSYTVAATVTGNEVTAPWTVVNTEGTWVRAWRAQDPSGIVLYTLPLVFRVVNSPGTPF